MIRISTFYLLSLLFTNFSCTNKGFVLLNSKENLICVGSGGGFTGIATSYFIRSNGEIYRTGRQDNVLEYAGKISLDNARQIFSNYKHLNIKSKTLNDPGNRYFFIENYNNGTSNHKVTWGYKPNDDKSLDIFYQIFMHHVKNLDSKL